MGILLHAEDIPWEAVPSIYTEHMDRRAGTTVRKYTYLGIESLNIVVLFDGDSRSYSHIPCYE